MREIADVLIAECKAGNIQAIKELADRLDGRPAQILEHGGDGEQPVRVTCTIVHERQVVDGDYQDAEIVPTETKLIGTETNGTKRSNGSNGHGQNG